MTRFTIRPALGLVAAVVVAGGVYVHGGQGRGAQPANGSLARTADGKPNLNGIWQVVNSANWDLEAHSAEEGIPGGLSVVEGGTIPYLPAALARRNQNRAQRKTADPLSKCYIPGVPRVTY